MSQQRYQQLLTDYVWFMCDKADISSLAEIGAFQLGSRAIGLWLELNEKEPNESRVICRCDVMQIIPEDRRTVYRALLEAHCVWQGTEGATLALRNDEIVIVSITQRLVFLNVTHLHELLDSLSRDANRWERVLQRSSKKSSEPMRASRTSLCLFSRWPDGRPPSLLNSYEYHD